MGGGGEERRGRKEAIDRQTGDRERERGGVGQTAADGERVNTTTGL